MKKKTPVFTIVLILLVAAWLLNYQKEIQSEILDRAPIVGLMQENRVPIRVKGLDTVKEVRIKYQKEKEPARQTDWVTLSPENDHSADIWLNDLEYNTNYQYQVVSKTGGIQGMYSFKTFPRPGTPAFFTFGFSACAREKYQPHSLFSVIEQLNLTFFALMGDTIYADYDGDLNEIEGSSKVIEAFRSKYDRNLDTDFQGFMSRTPIVATWDDHDYGDNNSDRNYRYKEHAKKVFKEVFPSYPYSDENGGIYYSTQVGDVDIFVLDTRWYRVPMEQVEGPNKTMLGPQQLEWLLAGLKNSKSTFKLVFSGVPWNDWGYDTTKSKPGAKDSWAGYTYERKKIFKFISKNKIKGVLFFNGDQHFPSANLLNWKKLPQPFKQADKFSIYRLKDVGSAVFDFSASPISYRWDHGEEIKPYQKNNPRFSHEIFRQRWTGEEAKKARGDRKPVSIFAHVKVNTVSRPKSVSVSFAEIDRKTKALSYHYWVEVQADR